MRRSVSVLAFVVVLLAASVKATIAAEPPAAPDLDPWRYNVALYGWALGVTGNVTARNQTIDTNASFIDIVQKSDSLGAFMGYFEADKGRLGVYTDLVFAKLGFGAGQTNYRNPLPGLSITTTANAALTYQLFIVEMGGVYEFFRWPGTTEGSSTSLDGVLGFRYWNNSIDASFDATATVNRQPRRVRYRAQPRLRRRDSARRCHPMGRPGDRPAPAPPVHAAAGDHGARRRRRLRRWAASSPGRRWLSTATRGSSPATRSPPCWASARWG